MESTYQKLSVCPIIHFIMLQYEIRIVQVSELLILNNYYAILVKTVFL